MVITDPVGISELATRAGVKPDTVQKWRIRHPDFPAPTLTLAAGPIWEWATIAEWIATRRI